MKTKILGLVAVLGAVCLLSGCRAQTDSVRVGAVLSMTGPIAPYGNDNLKGIETARDYLNAKGGLFGHPIELVVSDDGGDPVQAATAARRLSSDPSISLILGPTRTGCAIAISKILPDLKVAMISVGSTGDWESAFGGPFNEWTFRSTRTDTFLIGPLIAAANKKFGIRRLAVISTGNDDWSVSVRKLYLKSAAEQQIDIVADVMQSTGDTDRSAQLSKIRAATPDAVIVNTNPNDAAGIAAQARRMGIRARFIGTAGFSSPAIWRLAPDGALDGTLVGENFYLGSTRTVVRDFVKAFQAKYNVEPPPYSAYAFDGMLIAMDAIRRSGHPKNRDEVRQAIAATKSLEGVLGSITYADGRGDARKPALVLEIRSGGYRLVE